MTPEDITELWKMISFMVGGISAACFALAFWSGRS